MPKSRVFDFIKLESNRQREVLEMIPSENYASKQVMEALGSVLTNKYSEGYPKKRYYQGNKIIDDIEIYAEDLAKKLFKVPYVNVQPYSGSPANAAVYLALLEPLKDKIMGLSLSFGGHLTHGAPVSFSGKYFKIVPYNTNQSGVFNYNEIEKIALREKPKLIICGATAYPRTIDFQQFAKIADRVGAYLLADISHIAGLIVSGVHPDPSPFVHIIMTTTHKTLRGPRGAILMVTEKGLKKDPGLPEKLDKAVFPGLQGGPHDNQTAAIAIALEEASSPSFKKYGAQIVKNAKTLAGELNKFGFNLVSGGTDNHLLLIDLTQKRVNGAAAALALEVGGIVVNKNAVPNDPMPPFYPSGIRLGTPALTSRGMDEKDMIKIANFINQIIDEVSGNELIGNKDQRLELWRKFRAQVVKNKKLLEINSQVTAFAKKFPVPGI